MTFQAYIRTIKYNQRKLTHQACDMHIFNESPYFVSAHLLCFIFVRLTLSVWDYFNCHFFIINVGILQVIAELFPSVTCVCYFRAVFYWTFLVLSPIPEDGSIRLASGVLPKHLSRLTGQTSEASDVMRWPGRCVEGWKSRWCLLFKSRESVDCGIERGEA